MADSGSKKNEDNVAECDTEKAKSSEEENFSDKDSDTNESLGSSLETDCSEESEDSDGSEIEVVYVGPPNSKKRKLNESSGPSSSTSSALPNRWQPHINMSKKEYRKYLYSESSSDEN